MPSLFRLQIEPVTTAMARRRFASPPLRFPYIWRSASLGSWFIAVLFLTSIFAAPATIESPSHDEAARLKTDAVRVAEEIAAAHPEDPLVYALLGSAYYNTGKSVEATAHLRRCLELRPDMGDAYDILARIAYETGHPEESVRLSQEALNHGAGGTEALHRLGRALLDLGRTGEAIQVLEKAAGLPRATSETWHLLGQAQMQVSKHAAAKQSFEKAVQLLPEHTQAYFGLYTACLRLGQTEQAARYREQFVALEAKDRKTLSDQNSDEEVRSGLPMVRATVARTLFGAAQIYMAHGQSDKATELLARASFLDENNPGYRAALESAYLKSNRAAEGIKAFELLAQKQPQNPLNYLFLGRLYSRVNNFEMAESSLGKVRKFAPDWAEGYRALADLYLRASVKTSEALELARRAVELEPSARNHYLLALAQDKNNDRQAALVSAKQAWAKSQKEKRYEQLVRQLEGNK